MIASRRAVTARHELRFGTRQVVLLVGAAGLVCAAIFAVGVFVGRGIRLTGGASARAGQVGARPEPAPKPAAAGEERLTFYKTLTAPTVDLPPVGQPAPVAVEERIVQRDEPTVGKAPPPKSASPDGRAPSTSAIRLDAARGRPAAKAGAPTGAAGVAVVGRAPTSAPPAVAGGGAPTEPQLWTVQVSSFRSRALADDLRARLAARGFDAYLVSAATEEGRVRYRVRVGAFPTRVEAERVVTELRAERTMSPFVTPRPPR